MVNRILVPCADEDQFKGKMKSFRTSMSSIVGERKEAQRSGGVKFQGGVTNLPKGFKAGW